MSNVATATIPSSSAPATSTSSPLTTSNTPARFSTPPPAPASAVPKDIRSSISEWWNNSSYKAARIAEERLLRRMAIYEPPSAPLASKGWFGWNAPTYEESLTIAAKASGETVMAPVQMDGGLTATLKNVWIPTPDPADAPLHPADPRDPNAPSHSHPHHRHSLLHRKKSPNASASSSTASLPTGSDTASVQSGRHHGKLVDYINTVEVTSAENANSKEAVVMLHGYAAALGFFFRNWESVAQAGNRTGRRTFFLDWLGMGLSSRPSPSLMSSPSSSPVPARVARAEHFFLSSLESWREREGIDKMILVGHSLGGYLASAYTVRYPERVSGLILVSPAGIPRGPEYKRYPLTANTKGVNEGANRDEAAEVAEEELTGKDVRTGEGANWGKNASTSRKLMMKFFVWGWDKGISPFQFLRGMGPFGPMFAANYSSRRFANQKEEDIRDLHAYIYNTSILKGSGEFCISHILAPGAYARVPIIDRIGKVKVPVTFIYGANDWMDVDGGKDSVKELEKAGNSNAKVHVVANAGHHVYLDNPEDTNRIIDEAIEAIPRP